MREAVTNAVKHPRASRVLVHFAAQGNSRVDGKRDATSDQKADAIDIEIADNGIGHDKTLCPERGLANRRARAEMLGRTLVCCNLAAGMRHPSYYSNGVRPTNTCHTGAALSPYSIARNGLCVLRRIISCLRNN
jgi:hypothetical protein